MNYKIQELEDIIFVQSEGKTREEGVTKLKEYLENQNIQPISFYYLELYNKDGVAGAYTFAKVNEEPEHSRKFRSNTLKSGPYFILDISYQEYLEAGKPGAQKELDIKEIVKKEGYSIADFPFFEFLDSEQNQIRVYVKLK